MSEEQFAQQNLVIDDPSRRGNPLHYPVVRHQRFLLDCLSPATAYCLQNYPYGGHGKRCIQRHWMESATKGAKKGQWRLMSQTTTPAWNERYSENLAHVASLAAGPQRDEALIVLSQWLRTQWETIRHENGKPYWNNPKGGVYHYFSVWEEMYCWKSQGGQPIDTDQTPTVGIQCFALHYNSKPADFERLIQYPIQVTPVQFEGIRLAALLSKFPVETITSKIEIITQGE